ncbi:MAG: hypothetical protein V1848_03855 [Candidatus Magasanikbacteria bacterium]
MKSDKIIPEENMGIISSDTRERRAGPETLRRAKFLFWFLWGISPILGWISWDYSYKGIFFGALFGPVLATILTLVYTVVATFIPRLK